MSKRSCAETPEAKSHFKALHIKALKLAKFGDGIQRMFCGHRGTLIFAARSHGGESEAVRSVAGLCVFEHDSVSIKSVGGDDCQTVIIT